MEYFANFSKTRQGDLLSTGVIRVIKLFGGGGTRWVRPYWTLKELGVPFEPVKVSILKGETKAAAFLAINPFGKLPALQDGDFQLFESAAICNYLADKYSEKSLAPKPGTQNRALYDQWVSFVISDLEQPLWRITRHKYVYPEAQRSLADCELAKDDFRTMAAVLEKQINGEFLVADRFSVADIVMTYTLKWATLPFLMGVSLLEGFPKLEAYMLKHTSRPAYPAELYT